jgi:hypothetical protein
MSKSPLAPNLGGLDTLQRRQKSIQSKLATHCVANLKQKCKKRNSL